MIFMDDLDIVISTVNVKQNKHMQAIAHTPYEQKYQEQVKN